MKKKIIILISFAVLILFFLIPPINGLSQSGMHLIGIALSTLILWLFVGIDWPSILLIGLLSLLPELSMNTIIQSSYGNSTILFLLLTFILTYSLSKTVYINKIAIMFITCKLAYKSTLNFILFYSLSILFIGMFISPTVLFFVFLPILYKIYELLKIEKGDKLANILMILTVLMSGISSGMTPIAHAFPITAIGLYEKMYQTTISYLDYMIIGIPTGIITALIIIFILSFTIKNKYNLNLDLLKANKPNKSEKIILIVFIIVVLMWILPSFPIDMLSNIKSLGIVFPPLLGVVALSIISYDGKPLLDFSDALKNGVNYPSIIMCAGALALASAITNNDIGILTYITNSLSAFLVNLDEFFIILIFALWAIIQTNFSSNLVTASVVTTAALAITSNLNIDVQQLVIVIGILASFSFATPSAMPCVAVATSSGYTPTSKMFIYGLITMLISVIIIMLMTILV